MLSIHDELPGITDDEVIQQAHTTQRILITNDKDFGEKVYRESLPHCGVILLRLENERSHNKIFVLERLLSTYGQQLGNRSSWQPKNRYVLRPNQAIECRAIIPSTNV